MKKGGGGESDDDEDVKKRSLQELSEGLLQDPQKSEGLVHCLLKISKSLKDSVKK